MRALVTRDSIICDSSFEYFDGTNPITGQSIQLQSLRKS